MIGLRLKLQYLTFCLRLCWSPTAELPSLSTGRAENKLTSSNEITVSSLYIRTLPSLSFFQEQTVSSYYYLIVGLAWSMVYSKSSSTRHLFIYRIPAMFWVLASASLKKNSTLLAWTFTSTGATLYSTRHDDRIGLCSVCTPSAGLCEKSYWFLLMLEIPDRAWASHSCYCRLFHMLFSRERLNSRSWSVYQVWSF